ncbi:hypothetical protein LSCM1_04476 [Leishmania martiniquensis]|uniref:Uncharacterized protein n=1 Tax=Leishmania martiniquensis TaxID=1580590 RepID=A0A836GK86_9TRYP|nr:hypothetical protein LSCM1_04476 [Leishmania martiniquensis]
MHFLVSFHTPCLRLIRRLCLPRRYIAATHAHIVGAVAGAVAASQRAASHALHAEVGYSRQGAQTETDVIAEATSVAAEDASAYSPASAAASSTAGTLIFPPSPTVAPLRPAWTVDQMYAILQRHEFLCGRIPLLCPASMSAGLTTSFLPTAVDNAAEDLDTAARDPHRASPRRGPGVSATAVREIQEVLDRLAQDPHRLRALNEKQRHRLVTAACRVGYAVGLHSRCCALYADTLLLGRCVSDGDRYGQPAAASGPSLPSKAALELAEVALPSVVLRDSCSIPDFIIDAAGQAADLTTLHLCLPQDAHASPTEASAVASSSLLTTLYVYAQCVRVLLSHGWGGCLASRAADVDRRTDTSGERVSRQSRDVGGPPADCLNGIAAGTRNASTCAAAVASPATALSHTTPGEASEQERWRYLALTALRRLRIDAVDAEDFLRTSLQRASYRYTDACGDWTAVHSSVYAQAFCYWLEEEEVAVSTPLACQRRPQYDGEVEGRAGEEHHCISTRAATSAKPTASAPVLLTVPALLMLLRTAVVARQHDIAEWATLWVDACLEEWARSSKVAAACRIAAPLPPIGNPSAQSLPQLDALLAWYLRYLQQSGQRRRAVSWLSSLRRRQATVPILASALATLSVAREAARLASDEVDADLAMWCLQLCLRDTAPALSPGHTDIFQCLCAYARCGLPNFDMVLQSLRKNGLLTPTPEEELFVRLLHARRSVYWRTEWERCVAPYIAEEEEGAQGQDGLETDSGDAEKAQGSPRATRWPPSRPVTLRTLERAPSREGAPTTSLVYGDEVEPLDGSWGGPASSSGSPHELSAHRPTPLSSVFSSRVIYQLLLILQEGEHPSFMSYYRALLLTFSERATPQDRAKWVVLALKWAIQLHGRARRADVVYIALEVEQLTRLQQRHTDATTASSLSLSPEVWHRLSRKWAMLYQQYPPALWRRAATTEMGSGGGTRRDAPPQQLLCIPSAAVLSTTPVLARFAKRRCLLPSSAISATELLRTSRRASAEATVTRCSQNDTTIAKWPSPGAADLESWMNYVGTVRRF